MLGAHKSQTPMGREPFSLYIHVPYCIRKCPYCDFNSHVAARIPEREYTEALVRELDFQAAKPGWQGRSLKSIFFGGGTPSTFSPESIARVLATARSLFACEPEAEITLEANPGSVDSRNFHGYRACGVNRISIGAQSFRPHLLRFLGRVHTADETRAALKIVRQAGFENFSLDLIYATPGQSLSDLRADLAEALSYRPPHLSAYNLTIEEGTPFARELRSGKLRPLPEETEIAMAEMIEETLSGEGLERYEISNYARAGLHSRHNINYWQGGDYLGIGAGAHSYRRAGDQQDFYGSRWHNEKIPSRYMENIRTQNHAVADNERIDLKRAAGEFMFLGLRMTRGIAVRNFSRRFGKDPAGYFPQITDWMRGGWMERKNGRLRLTRRGLLVANALFVHFV